MERLSWTSPLVWPVDHLYSTKNCLPDFLPSFCLAAVHLLEIATHILKSKQPLLGRCSAAHVAVTLSSVNQLCTTTARRQTSQGLKVTFQDSPVSLSVPAQCRESSLPTKSFAEICRKPKKLVPQWHSWIRRLCLCILEYNKYWDIDELGMCIQ